MASRMTNLTLYDKTCKNILSETARLIELKLHVEHSRDKMFQFYEKFWVQVAKVVLWPLYM